MAKPEINPRKIVVLSGAGLSAPSGLKTFRDTGGLWQQYRLEEVATPEAWARHPQVVLDFYNERRTKACAASPNAGHQAIAELEEHYEVVVVTQNVDDLHERAGSTRIIHVHGELTKARSTVDDSLIYEIGGKPIRLGDQCALGSQLRPHIVWMRRAGRWGFGS
jgi:NAD-dependent deacetylase